MTPHDDFETDGLNLIERWLAGLVGFMLQSAGTVTVFVTDNQAGSAALVLVGTLLMIIGLQGTPVLRASKEFIELQQRRKLSNQVEELRDEGDADAARLVAEKAADASPRLRRDPVVDALVAELYERSVSHAVYRAADGMAVQRLTVQTNFVDDNGREYDAVITANPESPEQKRFVVEVKYARNLTKRTIDVWQQRFREFDGVLVVAGSKIWGLGADDVHPNVRFVLWRSRSDDAAIAAALIDLISSTS